MSLAIENPAGLDLPAAVVQLLQVMFDGYQRIIINKEFGQSLSGGRVLEVHPIQAGGIPELPMVVKVAAISLIQKEWQAYRAHIHRRLPKIAQVIGEPVLLPELGWAGICYTLMGGGGTFEVVSLREYCRRDEVSVEETQKAIERLLWIMQRLWGFNYVNPDFNLQPSYDPLLPVHLLIEHQPELPDEEIFAVNPASLSRNPPQLQAPVRVTDFTIKKVDLIDQTVTLDSGSVPVGQVRLKSQFVETMAAYQANDILEPVLGRVIETRASRLQDEVKAALGQDIDPVAQTVPLTATVDLPNPLFMIPHSLNKTRGVHIASIHGDFNLENILIEPETGDVSLIDFSEARQDHILHDFLRLETEVMTKLIPEILHRHQLPTTPTLAAFYWELHCAAFGDTNYSPTLPHSALEKPLTILKISRQTARNYFFEVNDLTEYYEGLIIYLLGALKFGNLNDLPEHPLPKQVAFWAATLARQLLTAPASDGSMPSELAAVMLSTERSTAITPQPETGAPTISEAGQKLALLPLDHIPMPASLPAYSRMPFSRNPLFVGREDNLRRLAKSLKGEGIVTTGQVKTAAITGLGGLGKTQLASEFVHRYGQFFSGGVFWLSFADASAVPAEIAACGEAGALNLRLDFGERPLDEQVDLVFAAWQEPLPRLLIFDNCEDPALLVKWRPVSGGCRVLITSRRADWDAVLGIQLLPLDVLPRIESVALLRKHYANVDDATLYAIAAELGDLPLALHLAGSYLARYQRVVTPAQYLAQLRDPALLGHRSLKGMGISPTGHNQSVRRAIALSYDQLDPDDPVDLLALANLARAACLAPGESIPVDLLMLTLDLAADDPENKIQMIDASERLADLGLVRRETDETIRLHRLVVAFVQDVAEVDLSGARAAVETALIAEAQRLNQAGYPALLAAWQSHLRAVTDIAQQRQDERGAELGAALARHLRQAGDYERAKMYQERSLAIWRQLLGDYDPTTARHLADLGHLYDRLKDTETAWSFFEQALATQLKTLGEFHIDTARTLNYMGFLLQTEDGQAEAQAYHERALRIRIQVLGEEHPQTAESRINLAFIHFGNEEWEAARLNLEQAHLIYERALGSEHHKTISVLEYLGEVAQAEQDLPQAIKLFTEVLTVRLRVLGEIHPETARILDHLTAVYWRFGQTAVARAYCERALAIRREVLGEDHPLTETSREKLVELGRHDADYESDWKLA